MEVEVIQRFLESVGQKADIDLYLKLFRAERKESFAILVAEAQAVRAALDPIHFDLRILHGLGLLPVVLLGLFDAHDADRNAARVKEWLEEDGVPARIVHAAPELSEADVAAIREAIAAQAIPLVSLQAAQALNVEARFNLLQKLSRTFETRKVIYLSQSPGLGKRGARPLSVINVTTDYDHLITEGVLSRRQQLVLRRTRQLLEQAPHRMTATVVNPLNLLRELFTVGGAGTLLRRGSQVEQHTTLDGIDRERLRALVESAFGRPMREGVLDRRWERVFLETQYRGAALLERTEVGIYLSKFVVERTAQGEGIGGDVWSVLVREYPSFYWRARPDNPIVPWYVRHCSGMTRTGDWQVFWRDIPIADLPRAIEDALARPLDLDPGPRRS